MSKSSKSCGYTGHMRTENRTHANKTARTAQESMQHGLHGVGIHQHCHHKLDCLQCAAQSKLHVSCTCKK